MLLAEVSIAILTGGKSKRFGSNKLLVEVGGKRLVNRIYDEVSKFSSDVFFQGNSVQDLEPSRPDVVAQKGALGGLYSALKNSGCDKTIVLAGDLPGLDPRILDELLKHTEADAVIPRWKNGHREPLCALYSRKLTPIIERMIEAGDMKISHLFEKVDRIEWVDIDELIESGCLDGDCFQNINRRQDLSDSE
jgi:molybdopterin-guanine dinucleotide biosynthesis protein A